MYEYHPHVNISTLEHQNFQTTRDTMHRLSATTQALVNYIWLHYTVSHLCLYCSIKKTYRVVHVGLRCSVHLRNAVQVVCVWCFQGGKNGICWFHMRILTHLYWLGFISDIEPSKRILLTLLLWVGLQKMFRLQNKWSKNSDKRPHRRGLQCPKIVHRTSVTIGRISALGACDAA